MGPKIFKHFVGNVQMQRVNLHTIAILLPAPDVLTGCHGEGCHRMRIASPQLGITTDSPPVMSPDCCLPRCKRKKYK